MTEPSGRQNGFLDGKWHLVAAECPDDQVPAHRVDLVFHDDAQGLRGAVLSRNDGTEVPLSFVTFNGTELRLKMPVLAGPPRGDQPSLIMSVANGRCEGAWDMPGVEHIRLKLVRARQ